MKQYEFLTVELLPDKLDSELESQGLAGWSLCCIVPMQRQVPARHKIAIQGQQPQQYEIELKFKLFFQKEICQE